MMKLVTHRDPSWLVDALARDIDEARRSLAGNAPLAPLIVIAPSRRLIRFLQFEVAQRLGAIVGVTWHHHQSLVSSILEKSRRSLTLIEKPLFEALVGASLQKSGGVGRYVARHPRGLQTLAMTIQDLRDAGFIGPDVKGLSSHHWPPLDRSTLQVLQAIQGKLEALTPLGIGDRATLANEASREIQPFATSFRRAFHFGAYELIGVYRDLVASFSSVCDMTVYAPGDSRVPAMEWAKTSLEESFVECDLEENHSESHRVFSSRLEDLKLSSSGVHHGEAWPIDVFDAPGPRAELGYAARLCRQWIVEEGLLSREICVMARTLDAYEPHIDSIFSAYELAYTTSATTPILRWPGPRAALSLMRALESGLAPKELDSLARLGAIDFSAVAGKDIPSNLWDSIVKRIGNVVGKDAWRARLRESAWANDDTPFRRVMTTLLEALETWESCRGARDHARFLRSLFSSFLKDGGKGDPKLRAVWGALDTLEALEGLGIDTSLKRIDEVLSWMTSVLRGESTPLVEREEAGIAVLDVMQARGQFFKRVILIGFNAGHFPRRGAEDPFLSDKSRRALSKATRRPLRAKRDNMGEERLLLAMTLSSASERIVIGYQRTDEGDGTKSPSLMIRELAQASIGESDSYVLLDEARNLSGHPAFALQESAQQFGWLTPSEGLLHLALNVPQPRIRIESLGNEIGGASSSLIPALEFVEVTENFGGGDFRFDAMFGNSCRPETLSPSKLEVLGKCPLRFFFQHVLKIREPDPNRGDILPQARDVGDSIHRVLSKLYEQVHRDGGFTDPSVLDASKVRAHLKALSREEFHSFRQKYGSRTLGVLEGFWARWMRSVERFVKEDLNFLIAGGWKPKSFEIPISATLEIMGQEWKLSAQMDRSFEDAGGTILISDYKTGSLRGKGSWNAVVKGTQLQMPLYMMIAREQFANLRVDGEFLGVAPRYVDSDTFRVPLDHADYQKEKDGFEETLQALGELLDGGNFPFQSKDAQYCQMCPYQRGCRRLHPPSDQRVRESDRALSFFALENKNAVTSGSRKKKTSGVTSKKGKSEAKSKRSKGT